MLSEQIREQEQTIFAALADPMRRSLLVKLAENSPKTATQLAQEYPITRQGVLKHLTILEAAGLVAVHQAGREKRYTLTPEPLGELEQWIKEIGATWDARLLRLKTLLEQEVKENIVSDLQTQFETAARDAQQLPSRPDNETLLQLYALYKQATAGDTTGSRPGFTDFVGRAKYDAWAALKGTTREAAMQRYVDLVASLKRSTG